MRKPLILTLSAMSLAIASPARAKTVKGPTVAVEGAQNAEIQNDDGEDSGVSVARRRTEANLLIPIPAEILGGMLVLKDDFFQEDRVYELGHEASADRPDDVKHPNVAGLGAVYLPHPKEGAPRFFLLTARYGELRIFKDRARPMSEYGVGADIADTDLPFSLKLAPTDQTETRIFLRYRQFPGFHKWLLLVGHKIDQANGFTLDVTIPSHVLAAYRFPGDQWAVYMGVRWVSREYPFDLGYDSGWSDGFVTTRLIGVRRQLMGPLHLALEGGAQKEVLRYVDEKGEELEAHQTAYAPWMRLALETWVKTP